MGSACSSEEEPRNKKYYQEPTYTQQQQNPPQNYFPAQQEFYQPEQIPFLDRQPVVIAETSWQGPPSVKFVVGVDFGTTFSGFAIIQIPDEGCIPTDLFSYKGNTFIIIYILILI